MSDTFSMYSNEYGLVKNNSISKSLNWDNLNNTFERLNIKDLKIEKQIEKLKVEAKHYYFEKKEHFENNRERIVKDILEINRNEESYEENEENTIEYLRKNNIDNFLSLDQVHDMLSKTEKGLEKSLNTLLNKIITRYLKLAVESQEYELGLNKGIYKELFEEITKEFPMFGEAGKFDIVKVHYVLPRDMDKMSKDIVSFYKREMKRKSILANIIKEPELMNKMKEPKENLEGEERLLKEQMEGNLEVFLKEKLETFIESKLKELKYKKPINKEQRKIN